MNPTNVLIASITSYESVNEERFKLAVKMAEEATKAGYTVILVDDSPTEVWGKLKEAGAHVYRCSEKGMGFARRESVKKAERYLHINHPGEQGVIIMTEPEKSDIIRFIPEIIEEILKGNSDIVIPMRSEKSWKSYPWFQEEIEKVDNFVYSQTTGIRADPMFGPVAFHSDVAPYFKNCKPSTYGVSDNYIQHIAPIEACREGKRICAVEIDFIYPPEQKAEEEGTKFSETAKKRLWQQKQLVETYFKVGKALQLTV